MFQKLFRRFEFCSKHLVLSLVSPVKMHTIFLVDYNFLPGCHHAIKIIAIRNKGILVAVSIIDAHVFIVQS